MGTDRRKGELRSLTDRGKHADIYAICRGKTEGRLAAEVLGSSVMDRGEARTRATVTAFTGRHGRGPVKALCDTSMHHVGPFLCRQGCKRQPTSVIYIYKTPIIVCSVHRTHNRCAGREP